MSSMIFDDSLGHLGTSFSAEVLQTILKEFGILEDIGYCICLPKLTTVCVTRKNFPLENKPTPDKVQNCGG